MTAQQLCEMAKSAMAGAYAPYSGYQVGAALCCADGSVYTGCNIENASFSATCCAERCAIYKAVSDGKKEFRAIAICGGRQGIIDQTPAVPCGICRQVLGEFCTEDFLVYVLTKDGIQTYTLAQLFPFGFSLEQQTEE